MGTLLKFLLIALAVIWLLYSPAVRGKLQGRNDGTKSPPQPKSPGPKPGHVDTMVACAHCGVHLPASEALTDHLGRPCCCAAHRDRVGT